MAKESQEEYPVDLQRTLEQRVSVGDPIRYEDSKLNGAWQDIGRRRAAGIENNGFVNRIAIADVGQPFVARDSGNEGFVNPEIGLTRDGFIQMLRDLNVLVDSSLAKALSGQNSMQKMVDNLGVDINGKAMGSVRDVVNGWGLSLDLSERGGLQKFTQRSVENELVRLKLSGQFTGEQVAAVVEIFFEEFWVKGVDGVVVTDVFDKLQAFWPEGVDPRDPNTGNHLVLSLARSVLDDVYAQKSKIALSKSGEDDSGAESVPE